MLNRYLNYSMNVFISLIFMNQRVPRHKHEMKNMKNQNIQLSMLPHVLYTVSPKSL